MQMIWDDTPCEWNEECGGLGEYRTVCMNGEVYCEHHMLNEHLRSCDTCARHYFD